MLSASKFGWIQRGTTLKGKCIQEFAFQATINKVDTKKGEFEGTCHWPDLDNTTTSIKGTLKPDGSAIDIHEMEVIQGDGVEVPMHYTGQVVPDGTDPKRRKIEGTFSGEDNNPLGKFSIPL
jgi:hypothetical protein